MNKNEGITIIKIVLLVNEEIGKEELLNEPQPPQDQYPHFNTYPMNTDVDYLPTTII